jgi:hypothetical protein
MTTQLSEDEFKSTITDKMIDVTETANAVLNIWPYVQRLTKEKVVLDYVYKKELVEKVYRNDKNTFDHVLLPTSDSNAFIVIIVNLMQKNIRGHYRLDIKKEYGLG